MEWVRNIIQGMKTVLELGSASHQLVGAYRQAGEKIQLLKRKSESLTSMASDKEKELEHAESLGKRRKAEVDTWLKQAEWIGADVRQIDEQVAQAGILQRPLLASRMDERTREVDQLIEQGEFPTGLTLDVKKNGSIKFPTCELVGQAFESNKQKILECLSNGRISVIGIHGMGGVGKTTLATHIYNELLKKGDEAHWITVSHECSISKLQSDLAHRLHVDLSHVKDNDKERAARLWDALEEKKKVIILDDVWNHYPLEEVGIPVGGSGACKLILTARSSKLCHEMGCHELINVESLPEEEAWQLFKKNLLRCLPLSGEVDGMARLVANECSGLPLAITVLSGSMRGVEDIHEWRHVLNELRASRTEERMENEVFRVLRFSYDRLNDETVRQCFTHFALYPEDHEVKRGELVQHFIDVGLLRGRSNREAATNRGHAVINKLLGLSLLEYGKKYGKDFVKMHDLVRDMVISMNKTQFLVLAKLRIREIQLEEWTEELEKISLMYNDISEIPPDTSPRCPKLSVLLLNGNPLRSMPDEFFKHMTSLQLLDLSGTRIKTLPSSIKDLGNLTTLNLSGCRDLHDLPPLEKLVSLNMEGSGLKTWATLSHFSHLRHLNLLYTKARMKASELKSLRKLEMLICQFDEVEEFNAYAQYLNNDGCVRFYVVHLTGEPCYVFSEHARRTAVLEGCRIDGNLLLPRSIDEFRVRELDGPRSLSNLLSLHLTTFTDLKHCSIIDWRGMECFISLASSASIPHCIGTILPALETLQLRDLPGLQLVVEIFEDGYDKHRGHHTTSSESGTAPMPPWGAMALKVSMFPRLKRLIVDGCPRIQKLLPVALLHSLVNLEEIIVQWCESMTEIVASEATEGDGVMATCTPLPFHLPKLRELYLCVLPKLRSICGNGTMMLGDSIETVTITGCHKLERIPLHLHPLPNGRVSFPPLLRQITIEKSDLSWWESLVWDHNTAKEVLRPPLLRAE